jgi:hypothetical protein
VGHDLRLRSIRLVRRLRRFGQHLLHLQVGQIFLYARSTDERGRLDTANQMGFVKVAFMRRPAVLYFPFTQCSLLLFDVINYD